MTPLEVSLILEKILSNLLPEDVISISMVSNIVRSSILFCPMMFSIFQEAQVRSYFGYSWEEIITHRDLCVAIKRSKINLVRLMTKYTNINNEIEVKENPNCVSISVGKITVYDLYTPLTVAVCEQNITIVKDLIALGADVNIKNAAGDTAIRYASMVGNKKIISLLIANKADVNASHPSGTTPLMSAIMNNHFGAASLLIENGANIDSIRTISGLTALMEAIKIGNPVMVKKLIDAGADIHIRSRYGRITPLILCQRYINKTSRGGMHKKKFCLTPSPRQCQCHMEVMKILINVGAEN